MKKSVLSLLACLLALPLCADDLAWTTSLPDAQARAKTEGKLVFVNFTGTDWCPACEQMDKDVLEKPQFVDYAKTNLVLVQIDFPIAKKQTPELEAANAALTNKFEVRGFPTFLVFNPSGKLVWKQEGYLDGGPKTMIAKLNKAKKKK